MVSVSRIYAEKCSRLKKFGVRFKLDYFSVSLAELDRSLYCRSGIKTDKSLHAELIILFINIGLFNKRICLDLFERRFYILIG